MDRYSIGFIVGMFGGGIIAYLVMVDANFLVKILAVGVILSVFIFIDRRLE